MNRPVVLTLYILSLTAVTAYFVTGNRALGSAGLFLLGAALVCHLVRRPRKRGKRG